MTTEIVATVQPYIGTVPQWGMFLAVMLAFLKLAPVWRKQTFDQSNTEIARAETLAATYRAEVQTLRKELRGCEEECAAELKALHEEMFSMRKSNIQEQISLVNVILRSVDAPELKTLLAVLEQVKGTLAANQIKAAVIQTQSGFVIQADTEGADDVEKQ